MEAVSLGSHVLEILVVNIGTGHPYLTDIFGIPENLIYSKNSLYCLNPALHRFSLKPLPGVGIVAVVSGWHNPFPILVFAAVLALGTRTGFEGPWPSFPGCGCVVCYPNVPKDALLELLLPFKAAPVQT